MKKIAVIGTGNVGGALGTRWSQLGYDVVFGSRAPQAEKVQAVLAQAGDNATAATIEEAVAAAGVVVVATPWSVAKQVIESAPSWAGKVLVDCTNPIAAGMQSLSVGATTSAAEQIASWAEGARVVKAFNTTGWENMVNPTYGGEPTAMFICGDDADAKAQVAELAEALGFEVADTGHLITARFLEPLALVWIHLAFLQGWGSGIAFKIVRR